MKSIKSLSIVLTILMTIVLNSTDAVAKKPSTNGKPSDETPTVLSNKEALNLAKIYIGDFQAVDPEFTLKQLKSFILDLNTSSLSEIDTALESYLNSLQPAPDNQPPQITGTPQTELIVGEVFVFTPLANDADGDNLTFQISNLPHWASFDSQSGTVSGTPDELDTGVYTDIVISVSDGLAVAMLAPFSLTVNTAQSLQSITLTWTAPTTRADNTSLSLSEIDGYRLYMRENGSELTLILEISDNSVTEHTLTDLPSGDYEFALTVYDIGGIESDLSNVVTKSLF